MKFKETRIFASLFVFMNMLDLIKINTKSPEYHFVETLMHSAFPPDERRDGSQQRQIVDGNGQMQCLVIKDGDVNVGFFTLWTLSAISYVEHFAIAEQFRRRGYGTLALTELIRMSDGGKLILEVELPSTEETVGRISFYEKCGFSLSSRPYIQPPYSPSKQSMPMSLMTCGNVSEQEIETAVDEIYRMVYKV